MRRLPPPDPAAILRPAKWPLLREPKCRGGRVGWWRPDIADILRLHLQEVLASTPTASPLGISYAEMARMPPRAERNRGEEPAALTDPKPEALLCPVHPVACT